MNSKNLQNSIVIKAFPANITDPILLSFIRTLLVVIREFHERRLLTNTAIKVEQWGCRQNLAARDEDMPSHELPFLPQTLSSMPNARPSRDHCWSLGEH